MGLIPWVTPRPAARLCTPATTIRSTAPRSVGTNSPKRVRPGSGQRKLRGGGESASSTAHDSEQPVGCVAVGEGEW